MIGRCLGARWRSLAGVMFLLCLLASPYGAVASSTQETEDEASQAIIDDDRRDAARIRRTFGFPSDDQTIDRALSDARAYPNLKWGTALTEAEAAEIDRQVDIQTAFAPTADWASRELEGFGGVWIDRQAGGRPVVMVNGDILKARDAIALRADGVEIDVRQVDRSYADLLEIRGEIEDQRKALQAAGLPLVTTGIRPSTNSVVIGLSELTPASEADLRARFGNGLEFVHHNVPHPDLCPASNCAPPTVGGIETHMQGHQASPCTTAVFVKVVSPLYRGILTAGHCFHVGGNSGQGTEWYHELTGSNYHVGEAERNTWFDGANADVALIDLDVVPTDRNDVWEGFTFGFNSITHIATNAEQTQNFFLCRMGKTSGADCGQITLLDETMPSPLGSTTMMIDHQNLVDFDSQGGDSGGPYYSGSTGHWGLGIHTHSLDPEDETSWYSTLKWAESAYLSHTGVNYDYCITDSCP